MRTSLLTACVCLVAALAAGCFSAKAPDNIYIGGGPRSADVDSSTVPRTRTHEEAKAELVKAYQQIRYLEHERARCKDKLEDAEERADEYENKYEDLKDRHDD
jgi:hypothetical protein